MNLSGCDLTAASVRMLCEARRSAGFSGLRVLRLSSQVLGVGVDCLVFWVLRVFLRA